MELYKSKYSDKKKSGGRRRDDSSRSFRNSRDDRFSRDRKRESATVTCADCGDECEVPFVPRTDRPVYCSDCFRKNKPEDSGRDNYSRDDRYSRDSRRDSRRNDRYSRDDRQESTTVTCADCGDECDVPFVPRTNKPVYCNDCFRQNKPDSGHDNYSRDDRGSRNLRDDRRESRRDDRYSRDSRRDSRRDDRGSRYSRDDRRDSGRDKPRKLNDRLSKKRESFFSNGSDKFYATIKEKLFEILGGKVCSSCGFKDERALGFSPVSDDSSFDEIGRGGAASSWGKYISEPELAREELKVLCLNCNEISQPVAKPKEQKSRPKQKKSKYFPR